MCLLSAGGEGRGSGSRGGGCEEEWVKKGVNILYSQLPCLLSV
jgi:hypothetical protein